MKQEKRYISRFTVPNTYNSKYSSMTVLHNLNDDSYHVVCYNIYDEYKSVKKFKTLLSALKNLEKRLYNIGIFYGQNRSLETIKEIMNSHSCHFTVWFNDEIRFDYEE